MFERKRTIGIVDDDEELCSAVDMLLTSHGYQTETFGSAEEFLNAAERSKAACLLIDIQLGDISGVELARQLGASGYLFPVIFMTGSHDDLVRRQAMEFGCVAFLHKPFPEDQLIESIVKATKLMP